MSRRPIILYPALVILGGVITYFILPAKIETVVETKVIEKVVYEKTDTHKTKITKPNGTVIETEDTQSTSETNEESKEEKYKKTITNPKKILIYAGKDILHPADRSFIAGFSYQLWSAIDVGAQYNKTGNGIYATIGIRF